MKSAMMSEAKCAAAESGETSQIGASAASVNVQRRQGGLAVQSGAPQAGSGQEMGDGLQAKAYCAMRETELRRSLSLSEIRSQASSVRASGTNEISTGKVPSSSPSASM